MLRNVITVLFVAFMSSLLQAQSIRIESKLDANGMRYLLLTNRSTLPLTAYSFRVEYPFCQTGQKPAFGYRGLDIAITPHAESLKPNESRAVFAGGGKCQDGRTIPAQTGPVGGVFEDGSTFGDAVAVAGILRGREYQLESIEDITVRLRAAQGLYKSREDLIADIRTAHSEFETNHRRTFAERLTRLDPYGTTIGSLSDPNQSMDAAVKSALTLLNELKTILLAARPPVQYR